MIAYRSTGVFHLCQMGFLGLFEPTRTPKTLADGENPTSGCPEAQL